MNEKFRKFAVKVAATTGNIWTFVLAVVVILIWAVTGPLFNFSNTWQLVINTGTTIVTFLMVFVIQNTQNRDSKTIHLKLDELLKGLKGARNSFSNIDELSDAELEELHQQFINMNEKYLKRIVGKKEKESKK